MNKKKSKHKIQIQQKMELAIPLFALGSLYLASKKSDAEIEENFATRLPNVNIPNRNFPEEFPVVSSDTDQTAMLSIVNKYDGQDAYTDKYFNPANRAKNVEYSGSQNPISSQSYQSLAGETVNSSYFQHNNMVPFFGSSQRTRLLDENSNEGLLDSMVGSGSQQFSKKEQSPLFAPTDNIQWAYGMPSTSDFVQSRMNVSQKMANVKPFEEERVGPGMGMNGQYSLGFNSGMMAREMWMPKDVDQMRATNKPRASGISLDGHEGPALSRITNRGFHAPVEKNRADRHFEMDSDRYFTTAAQGMPNAQTLHALQVDRDASNRSTSTASYTGNASHAENSATYLEGEYMPSTHQDLGAVPLGGASSHATLAREGDYSLFSNKAYTNNRTTSNVDDYFGAIQGAMGAVVAPLLDILRPSRKENTVGNLRPYNNATSTVKNSYLFNPADRPAPTMKEMTEETKGNHIINRGQNGMGYVANPHTPAYTTRQDTGDFQYIGAGQTTGAKQTRNYEAEYNQRNNDLKSSTIQGRMVPGNMKLMNGDINMRTNQHKDVDLDRRAYQSSGTMPYQSPSMDTMGRVAGNHGQHLYAGMQLDRNNGDVLSPLQENPFSHNILNAFR